MEAHVAAAVCMLPGHTSCNELHGCAAVRVQALGDGPCHAGVWLSMRMHVCVCAWGLGNAGAPMCDVLDAADGAAVRSCAAVARVQDKLG